MLGDVASLRRGIAAPCPFRDAAMGTYRPGWNYVVSEHPKLERCWLEEPTQWAFGDPTFGSIDGKAAEVQEAESRGDRQGMSPQAG